jgi:hypothetical protein
VWNFHTSTNARYIAFETMASNVISGFTNNGLPLTYWRDRVAGTTVLVGVTTNGARAFGSILLHSLSSDGRFVAFRSIDTNLTSDVIFHSDNFNLFIRDMFLGQTWTVNRHPAGHSTASFITGAQFSGDGNWLLYSSSDTDVLPGITDVNGSSPDLFIYYLPWRTNGLLSISFTGNQGAAGYVSDDFARLSSSGRFTLFTSFSTNLLPNTPDAAQRLFLRDQKAGLTRNAVPPAFPTPSFNAARHTITENERYIFFLSHVNFDPAVRKTDSAIELFRAPLYVPRLSLANSNIIVGEGLAGLSYVIESSTNLLHWTAISTNNADAHGVLIVKSRELSTGVPRFYRLLWP